MTPTYWTIMRGGHGMPCPYNGGIKFSHRLVRARARRLTPAALVRCSAAVKSWLRRQGGSGVPGSCVAFGALVSYSEPVEPGRRYLAHSQPYGGMGDTLVGIKNMKKTVNVDDSLLREAKLACGASTDTETVRLGLEALVRHAAYERLRALRGAEPGARDAPRRREKPSAIRN